MKRESKPKSRFVEVALPFVILLIGVLSLIMAAESTWLLAAQRRNSESAKAIPKGEVEAYHSPKSDNAQVTSTPIAMGTQTYSTYSREDVNIPTSYMIEGVPIGKQVRHLNCEFQSAVDLAAFYGIHLTWQELFLKVGVDPNGDPSVGFVGASIDDEPGHVYPRGYGVYALPIAKGLRSFGLNAHAFNGANVRWLKAKIANGQPVIVWTTYGMRKEKVVSWKTANGMKSVKGVPWEHTYTAIGFDENGIYLNDPVTARLEYFPWKDFTRSWGYLDNMALTIEPSNVFRK